MSLIIQCVFNNQEESHSLLDLGTFLWTEKYVHTYMYMYGVKPDFQDKETAFMKLKATYP